MEARTVQGSCLCGAVRFEIALPVSACGHCHCSMCRRAHGAGYVTWIVVPEAQFKLLCAEEALTRYRSSEHGMRSFCRACGSSLFCVSTHQPGIVDITLANLDGPIDLDPQFHVFFADRVDWMPVDEKLPKIGGGGS